MNETDKLIDLLENLPTDEDFLEWLNNTDFWDWYDSGKINQIRTRLIDGQCSTVCYYISNMFKDVEFWTLDDGGNDYHVFMKSGDMYYDAYNYQGVKNPNELQFVKMYMKGKYSDEEIMKHMYYISTSEFDDKKYEEILKSHEIKERYSGVKRFEDFISENRLDFDDYLHGYCQVWVFENYRPGDDIFVMTCFDIDIQDCALVHCGIMRDDKYIDVRGEMNTEKEVLEEFDYGPELETTIMNLEEFKKYCKKNKLTMKV